MGITGIDSVTVSRSNCNRTRRLYEDVLGLRSTAPAGDPGFSVGLGARDLPGSSRLICSEAADGQPEAVRAIAFAVGRGTLAAWRSRIAKSRADVAGSAWLFDEEYFCFADPGGMELALTQAGAMAGNDVQPVMGTGAILGLRSIEIDAGPGGEMAQIAELLGFEFAGSDGPVRRFEIGEKAARVAIDLFASPLAPRPIAEATPDRLTFRVSSDREVHRLQALLQQAGYSFEQRCDAMVTGLRTLAMDIALATGAPPRDRPGGAECRQAS
ncbi:MAG: hypothetical protein JWR80_1760 [Bradyrhizobium sp.]|nr:hypothetical protein [Bradyrhizobium sp.]